MIEPPSPLISWRRLRGEREENPFPWLTMTSSPLFSTLEPQIPLLLPLSPFNGRASWAEIAQKDERGISPSPKNPLEWATDDDEPAARYKWLYQEP